MINSEQINLDDIEITFLDDEATRFLKGIKSVLKFIDNLFPEELNLQITYDRLSNCLTLSTYYKKNGQLISYQSSLNSRELVAFAEKGILEEIMLQKAEEIIEHYKESRDRYVPPSWEEAKHFAQWLAKNTDLPFLHMGRNLGQLEKAMFYLGRKVHRRDYLSFVGYINTLLIEIRAQENYGRD